MVLEAIVNPKMAERHPLRMFLLGLLYATLGLLLALWLFTGYASMVMVFLTVMASLPLVYNTFKHEETMDKLIHDEKLLMKEHGKVLLYLMMLFLGFVVAFSILYAVLPEPTVTNTFRSQMETINAINNRMTGQAASFGTFMNIFSNNIRVMFFCIFFAFFYGAGSIFILTWNASVIGAAMGNLIRTKLSELFSKMGFLAASNYLHVISLSLVRYLPHGIFEILGYFIGGLAGGIISVAVIRHDFGTREFNHILADSLDLVVLAIVTLFIACLIEVFVTPALFHIVGGTLAHS